MTEKIGYLLLDGMNIAHATNSGPILKAGDDETQAIFGTLRNVRKSIAAFPMLKPIVLWDGPRIWRKEPFPEYKANRDKVPTKPYEIEAARRRASLKVQLPHLKRGLTLAGVPQLVATNLEADDLAGILTRRYTGRGMKVMLVSGDQDWLQLLGPGVGWLDTVNEKRITMATFSQKVGYEKIHKIKVVDADGKPVLDPVTGKQAIEEKPEWRGCPSPRAYLDCKAVMGDTGDNIPGVGGIGEVGAHELMIQFGSMKNFFNRMEIEKIKLPKKVEDFFRDEEKTRTYYRNLHLMDLAHPMIPKPENMIAVAKPTDEEAFTEFCKEFQFSSILKDVAGWLAVINQR